VYIRLQFVVSFVSRLIVNKQILRFYITCDLLLRIRYVENTDGNACVEYVCRAGFKGRASRKSARAPTCNGR
jgi:hypothetical protein